MSLTWFITIPEIKERLRKEYAMPRTMIKKEIVAPPLTKRCALIGTAFDYLLRFYIKKRNPMAVSREWIAETAFNTMVAVEKKWEEDGKRTSVILNNVEEAQKVLKRARNTLNKYLASKTTKATDNLLESAILLAQLDVVYRSGSNYLRPEKIDKNDVADLRNLLNIVNPDLFHAKRVCLLNPTFDETARLIGGADADLLVDDTIVDIKTTKSIQFLRKDFDQLIGYYILNEIDGMNGITPKPKVKKVAIYFSRFAYLHVYELNKIINRDTLPTLIDWFTDKAKERAKQSRIEFETE